MKIALAQLNYRIADFEGNGNKIISSIQKAKQQKVDLIVFAELATCGYPPLDFLDTPDFIDKCKATVNRIANECKGIIAIVGSPTVNPVKEGKNLFNSALVLQDGKITHTINKSLLPTYDVFDEYRYFESSRKHDLIQIKENRIALTICEDLWNLEEDPLYVSSPMDDLIKDNPDIIINIAASPFSYGHPQYRLEMLQRNVEKYNIPLYYVNQIGSQTELIFDGASLILDSKGNVVAKAKSFEEDYLVFDSENADLKNFIVTPSTIKYDEIYHALLLGLRDYFKKMNFKKAVLGLSGGVDSALVYTLAVKALGNENVKAILMPSKFSSSGSIDDSIELCKNLEAPYEIIPINQSFHQVLETLQPVFADLPEDVTEENIQARIRGILLMAISNKLGYILLNTSNKSELAVGYGTLYGDMCGGLSVIGDLYKTEVYELCRFINSINPVIPNNILVKAPSAELRAGQKDSDSLPDYEILDKILYLYIERKESIKQIVARGFDETIIREMINKVNNNEYKRKQFAPILRISKKAFGMGRRFPIVANY